jgi:hypothetical protein
MELHFCVNIIEEKAEKKNIVLRRKMGNHYERKRRYEGGECLKQI